MNWSDVIKKPGFSDLEPAQQDIVRQRWTDEVYLPQAVKAGWDPADVAALRERTISGYDNGQGYVTSFLASTGRGVVGTVSGIIGGAGAITGNESMQETADAIDETAGQYLPVNPSLKYTNLAGQAAGQAASMLASGGAAGVAGKAVAGVRAGTVAAQAAVLGTGGISEARDAAKEADQYGITGDNKSLKIATGILTGVGTELIPFGLGAETAFAKRLIGAGEKAVSKRTAGIAGDIATEATEETIGQIGNNAATAALAPDGTDTPALTSGIGEAAFGGAIGGATFGIANTLSAPAGPRQPRQPGQQAPPQPPPEPLPAGFQNRASAVLPVAPAGPAKLSDEEITALSVKPAPPEKVAVVAAALEASPDPAVAAEVAKTAAIAADLTSAAGVGSMVRALIPGPDGAPIKAAGTITAITRGTATVQTNEHGNVDVPVASLQVMANLPQPSEEQRAAEAKKKFSRRRFTSDPTAYPLVTAIVEAGISPVNPGAQLARARINRGESPTVTQQGILSKAGGYDDLPKVSEFEGRPKAQDAIRKMYRNGTTNTPDQALQQAAEFAGKDPANFYGNTAWTEIRDELMRLDADTVDANAQDAQMDTMEKQAIEFYAAIEDGDFKIDTGSLEPGNVLVIEGEEVTVTSVNRDDNGDVQSVDLRDGKKFGVQEIDATTALFVEEFKPEEAKPADPAPKQAEIDFNAPAAPVANPATELEQAAPDSKNEPGIGIAPASETARNPSPDLFADRADDPFNLTGEETAKEKAAREKKDQAAQEKATAESKAALEEAAPELPLSGTQKAEKWADETIARNKGQLLSGVPDPALLAAYAVKGSILIARGFRNFAKWSSAMIDEFGEAVRPYLYQIFAEARGNGGRPITEIPTEAPLPSPPEEPGLFEKLFGNQKKLVRETKEYEARNATRAALEVPLLEGIIDNHEPGQALEEVIGSMSPEQRTALHHRVIDDLTRMTGTDQQAADYAQELRDYIATVPELAGQRTVSAPALQYTNLVQAAAALSGIHGQTGAFSMILNTDNDQLKFDTGTVNLLRSDLGRLLGSQAGIGARIAEFARITGATHNAAFKQLGFTDENIKALSDATRDHVFTANEIEDFFASVNTSPEGPGVKTALDKLQRYVDAAAAQAVPAKPAPTKPAKPGDATDPATTDTTKAADPAKTTKPREKLTDAEKAQRKADRLAATILQDAVGPLVAKMPIKDIVRAFMSAPAHHRNSPEWRKLQITNWLTNNGIGAALAGRLAVNMDEMISRVLANAIFQAQEKYITRKGGFGENANLAKFIQKYQEDKAAVREAIKFGLLDEGTPWQAWFASVTGIQPLTAAEQSQIAAWETVLSSDRYFPSEKGVAAAKLRDLMDARYGEDVSGWELLAASYDASALSSGTTMAVQFTGPIGRLAATVATDMASALYSPASALDVMDSFLASVGTYMAELPNAFRYDTGGNFMGDSAMRIGDVAPLKKDLAKQRAVLADKGASAVAKAVAVARFARSAQDYLRQAMNAADSASVAGFQRYIETREVRRIMRQAKISKNEVAAIMAAGGFTEDAASLQADALGYTGALKARYVNDAIWAQWKEVVTAHASTPEAAKARMATLLHDAEQEAEMQVFVGEKRDRGTPFDPTDWALGKIQSASEGLFRDARKRIQAGEKASGSIERIILRTVLGFVGIPLNAARATMWYSPFSLFSWANYAAHKKGILHKENPYERSLGNAISVRQRMKESIIGNTALLIALAALKGMQDDDDWKVNGYGPDSSRFPEEAKAWRRLHTAFSIERIGKDGKAINLPFQRGALEPLRAPLMMLAGAQDSTLNSKLAKEESVPPGDILLGALRQLGLSSITSGMRNIGGMRDALQKGMDGKSLGSQAGFVASPIIPWSGTERWIRTWGNPEMLEQGFMNNIAFAHYRDDARPAINLFAQTLRPAPSAGELANKQFSGLPPGYSRTITPEDQRLYGWMQRTGKQPTTYSRLEVERRIERAFTDEEWYDYSLAAGTVRRVETLAALDGTLKIQRTLKIPGPQPDMKIMGKMKKGLLEIDPENKDAMREAGNIMKAIGARAHAAGLAAVEEKPAAKKKAAKRSPVTVY